MSVNCLEYWTLFFLFCFFLIKKMQHCTFFHELFTRENKFNLDKGVKMILSPVFPKWVLFFF